MPTKKASTDRIEPPRTAEQAAAVALADWQARDDELQAHRARLTAEAANMASEHKAALSQWELECQARLVDLSVPPPPPAQPDDRGLQVALARAQQQITAHRNDGRRAAYAGHLAEIESNYADVRQELTDRAAVAIAALGPILDGLQAWHRLLREARRASEIHRYAVPQDFGPANRMRPSIGISDLIEAAKGVDVCQPSPPQPRSESSVERGDPWRPAVNHNELLRAALDDRGPGFVQST